VGIGGAVNRFSQPGDELPKLNADALPFWALGAQQDECTRKQKGNGRDWQI
jgi:hypothetical protein